MLTKIDNHSKASSLINLKLLLEMSISIENIETIDTGAPSKQALDTHSRLLSKIFSQVYLHLFHEANTRIFVDDAPLKPTTKDVILSHIAGIFYVLLHMVTLPMLTHPAFALGLFHSRHSPNSRFWNKLESPTPCNMLIKDFLEHCMNNNNVNLSHNAHLISPNHAFRYHYLNRNIKFKMLKTT